jgi:TRAP-type transport system large permease protein
MSLVYLFVFIFFAVMIRIPVAFSFIFGTVLYFILDGVFPLSVVASRLGPGLDSFVLLALPLFIFAGNLLSKSGVAHRIFSFANSSVGHIPGGLGHVNVMASIIFAGMSGVAQADAAGLGKIELEEMRKEGYSLPFSAAITAASAVIGPIIPPSGVMVLYAVLANVPLDKLFLAGFLPGLILGAFLMITIYVMVKSGKIVAPVRAREPMKKRLIHFVQAAPALAIPAFLVVGLLTGLATPTELGALTCLFATLLGFIQGDFTWKTFFDCAKQTVKTTGVLAMLILVATPFTWMLGVQNAGQILENIFQSVSQNPLVILLIINFILLIAGSIMETAVVQLIAVPILAPIALLYGIDPIHFGLIFLINLLLGTLTPPFGVLLFVMMDLTGLSLQEMTKAIMPFYIPMLLFLVLITLVPEITTFIPSLFGG